MPNDGQSEVESLLRKYAQQRRAQAGAPLEMHPATRRMLQAEVARQYPADQEPEVKRGWAVWLLFWPRFAMAAALFAGLGIITWAVFRYNDSPSRGTPMARNLETSRGLTENTPAKAVPVKTNEIGAETQVLAARRDSKDRLLKETVAMDGLLTNESAKAVMVATRPKAEAESIRRSEENIAKEFAPTAVREETLTSQAELEQARKAVESKLMAEKALVETGAKAVARPIAPGTTVVEQDIARQFNKAETTDPTTTPPLITALADAKKVKADEDLAFGIKLERLDNQTAKQGITEYYFAYARDATDKQASGMDAPTAYVGNRRDRAMRAGGGGGALPGLVGAPGQPQMQAAMSLESKRQQTEPAAQNLDMDSANIRQRYAILAAAPAPAELNPEKTGRSDETVLASFELEQTGDRIRIIDVDGSIYEGSLEDLGESLAKQKATMGKFTEMKPADRKLAEANERPDATASSRRMAFQATGTSRKLGQPVTINGALITHSAVETGDAERETILPERRMKALGSPPARVYGAGPLRSAPAPAPVTAPTSPRPAPIILKVEGFIRVGTGPERPLNAVRIIK